MHEGIRRVNPCTMSPKSVARFVIIVSDTHLSEISVDEPHACRASNTRAHALAHILYNF